MIQLLKLTKKKTKKILFLEKIKIIIINLIIKINYNFRP